MSSDGLTTPPGGDLPAESAVDSEASAAKRVRTPTFSDADGLANVLDLEVTRVGSTVFKPLNELTPETDIVFHSDVWVYVGARQPNFSIGLKCITIAAEKVFEKHRAAYGLGESWKDDLIKNVKAHAAFLSRVQLRKAQPVWFATMMAAVSTHDGSGSGSPPAPSAGARVIAPPEVTESPGAGDISEPETCADEWDVRFDFSLKRAVRTLVADASQVEFASLENVWAAPGDNSKSRPARVTWNDGTWSKLTQLSGSEFKDMVKAVSRNPNNKAAMNEKNLVGMLDEDRVTLSYMAKVGGGRGGVALKVAGSQKLQILQDQLGESATQEDCALLVRSIGNKLVAKQITLDDLKEEKKNAVERWQGGIRDGSGGGGGGPPPPPGGGGGGKSVAMKRPAAASKPPHAAPAEPEEEIEEDEEEKEDMEEGNGTDDGNEDEEEEEEEKDEGPSEVEGKAVEPNQKDKAAPGAAEKTKGVVKKGAKRQKTEEKKSWYDRPLSPPPSPV